jgi:polyhydroxybutyrate depolymerase
MRNALLMTIWLAFVLYSKCSCAQPDSILENGAYRNFILHVPNGYSESKRYPLVLNLHGLNSNATEQELYSQFDIVADTAGFIVVYPNAVNGSWDLGGVTDINFITHLVDTIKSRYSVNNCLFSTGMSMGGFMTYKLACNLPLTAIAVVAGNMPLLLQNNCGVAAGLPLMHFHGTADQVVPYTGGFGIPPVETTIKWWVNKNNCNSTPVVSSLPNINLTDNCYVEQYDYTGGINGSTVTLYKIYNGGHTWPSGIIDIPSYGNTNRDINASALMGAFFSRFCEAINLLRWNGIISDVWENTQNWEGGKLPGRYSTVIIPSSAPHFPKISSPTTINSLELKPGSSVILGNGITLLIESK